MPDALQEETVSRALQSQAMGARGGGEKGGEGAPSSRRRRGGFGGASGCKGVGGEKTFGDLMVSVCGDAAAAASWGLCTRGGG